jgi:hypothetical protein
VKIPVNMFKSATCPLHSIAGHVASLTYKKATCLAIECSGDAYVALVLWAHKKG